MSLRGENVYGASASGPRQHITLYRVTWTRETCQNTKEGVYRQSEVSVMKSLLNPLRDVLFFSCGLPGFLRLLLAACSLS
jgi:hypothetical protein